MSTKVCLHHPVNHQPQTLRAFPNGLEAYLNLVDISDAILFYVIPWVATIVVVANMLVAILCAIIYLKTKKRNHKPAFVFIGFLALIDVILGRYVGYTNFDFFLSENPHHHHHIEELVCRYIHKYLSLTCDVFIFI